MGAVTLFALVSLALNVTSTGFLEADGITHYLYARWAIAEPHLLTNVWGRPVVTSLHALPAQLPGTLFGQPLGLIGVRLVSLCLAVGCAVMAWRVAVGQGAAHGHDRPALAAVFTLCMPLVILHSISELTELPFAFLAIVALWAYQKQRWWLMAVVAGLLPAARPEGFGFLLLALAALGAHRRWAAALLAPLPLILWDRLGWWLNGGVNGAWWQLGVWLASDWPYSGKSTYKPGPLLKFVGMLPAVVGPGLMPFALAGIVAGVRERGWRDHGTRVAWVIVLLPLVVLGVHSVLHWSGKMASSGDVRYLICVAPFWALLAARGWDWLSRRLRWRRDYLWAAGAGIVPLIPIHFAYPIVPLVPDDAAKEAVAIERWYDESELRRTHPLLLSDHPIIWYTRDMNPQRTGGGKERIAAAPAGAVFLWHDVYSTHNSDERYVVPADLPPRHGWRDQTPPGFPAAWRVFVSDENEE